MKKITIPIGSNVSIDGGPFSDFEGYGREGDHQEDAIHGRHRGDGVVHDETVPVEYIEDALADEMMTNQPIKLHTGDVGDGYTAGYVRLPLCAGYRVETFTLGPQEVWLLPNLNHYGRRRAIEQALANNGGLLASE